MASIIVRPLASPEEYTTYFRLANKAFAPTPSDEEAQKWQENTVQSPDYRSEQVHGVFLYGQLAGGCIVHERLLHMGAASISTGCIGAVVTAAEYRKQGIATALMQGTIDFARANNHALLELDGIAKFYYRYGYVDMYDVTVVEVDRSAILAQTPDAAYTIRPVTVEDASAILDLYQRHSVPYTGSFERTLELQAHRIRYARNPWVVVQSAQGHIVGYLVYGKDDSAGRGHELIADDWEATRALLHYHASLFSGDTAHNTLFYNLPADALLTQWMTDYLEVPDISQWRTPANEWSVRELTVHHRYAGWMARLVNYPALLQAILPELRVRWQRSLAQWSGDIVLNVDGESAMLRLDGSAVQFLEAVNTTA